MSSVTSQQFLKAIAARRSIYSLTPELPDGISIDDVQSVVESIIKHTPTSHNSQGNRAIILTGEAHRKMWSSVVDAIEGDTGKKRPTSIRDEAYGSIVFFIDDKTLEQLKNNSPVWASVFPSLADQSSGAAQMSAWTALELLGLGGHLQHYNGYINAALPEGTVPEGWKVKAQLVFGAPTAPPREKTFIENPVKVLK